MFQKMINKVGDKLGTSNYSEWQKFWEQNDVIYTRAVDHKEFRKNYKIHKADFEEFYPNVRWSKKPHPGAFFESMQKINNLDGDPLTPYDYPTIVEIIADLAGMHVQSLIRDVGFPNMDFKEGYTSNVTLLNFRLDRPKH